MIRETRAIDRCENRELGHGFFHTIRNLTRYFSTRQRKESGIDEEIEAGYEVSCFSAATYHNPWIPYFGDILRLLLGQRGLSYQTMELIVIEGGEAERGDVLEALEPMSAELNYLMLLTDEPEYYKDFVHRMYMDCGLIVQRMPKNACSRARGNLALDFERLDNPDTSVLINKEITRIPVYKKPWEISENLDITVPVGYNTLVVTGSAFLRPDWRQIAGDESGENIDRLDREFRKG